MGETRLPPLHADMADAMGFMKALHGGARDLTIGGHAGPDGTIGLARQPGLP